MKFTIDNRTPVYLQVVEYFKEQIASGQLKKGEEMPSRRELAATLKINPNTVQRAYKEMEEAGLIYTDGNVPSKVTEDEQIIKQVREQLLTEALEQFVTTAKNLHISFDDLLPLLKRQYEQLTTQGEKGKPSTRGRNDTKMIRGDKR